MPNRILRDFTASAKIKQISIHAERFFTRLIMKVDDYGVFPANTSLLKASLYPLLLDSIRESDITRWITECANTNDANGKKSGLILIYEIAGERYIMIQDFKQRLDKAKSKYPLPPLNNDSVEVDNEFPPETKRNETKQKQETKANRGFTPPALPDLVLYMISIGGTEDDGSAMFRYYTSNGWKVGKNKMVNWQTSAETWLTRKKEFQQANQKNGKAKSGHDIDAVENWYNEVTGGNQPNN